MSKKSKAYDNAVYQSRYSNAINLPAVAASTTVAKFIAFAAMKIKSIRANINVAGTATAAGYDIFNGTSSIGELLCGTSAAAAAPTTITPTAANGTLAEDGYIEIKTKAASATLAASAMIEYEITPGADITA